MENRDNRGHTVQLDQFEGPLDLLIFLIRKNEVNIYDIPVARITEQYMEFLRYATRVSARYPLAVRVGRVRRRSLDSSVRAISTPL